MYSVFGSMEIKMKLNELINNYNKTKQEFESMHNETNAEIL
jgi:hypothetical protein